MAASASRATFIPLKDYLKKYDDREEQGEKKKKKKKKSKTSNDASKLLVVDEDPIWQKQLKEEEDDDNISEEEKPQINEDIEVKRLKRLEELRAKRPYHVLSEDGSGWVSISGSPKSTNFSNSPPDWSPPRPNCTLSDQPLPKLPEKKKSGQPNGPDLSLPQRLRRDEPDISNLSPPRRRVQRNSDDPGIPDLSPPRRRARHDSEESDILDLSPPRKQVHHHSNEPNILDLDPPRKRIHHNLEKPNIPDLSPPRRRGFLCDSEEPIKRDLSLSRRQVRYNSEEPCIPDLSPPRRWDRHNPNEPKILDVSPSRRLLRRDPSEPIIQDLSPSRRLRRNSLDSDPSLARIPTDLTASRISRKNSSFGPKSKDKRAGLISGQEIKKENERKRKEGCSRLSEMDPSVIGQGAEPVYRDKEGKRVSRDEYLKLQQGEEKPKEKKLEWGKGLAQKREAEARELELELEKDKPFARSRDDPDLDKMLKERIRWGDPMAHLVKRKQPELVLEDLGDNAKMTESGFIIPQTIPSHSWLKRGIDLPANRYGIRPGRHWDGVDRSNGFEKEMFNKQNEKRATEQEAYLWSVSDM